MNITQQEKYNILKAYAIATGQLEEFVVLKEDEYGRYIEYAFTMGAPHDNRCLSWYDSLQPEALKHTNHDIEDWKENILHKVGGIYRLTSMACGCENRIGPDHCSPGHKCKKCTVEWSYEEPVKCACWRLQPVILSNLSLKIQDAIKFAEFYKTSKEK
jgi:hypothetical protein